MRQQAGFVFDQIKRLPDGLSSGRGDFQKLLFQIDLR
jgi:hypothetical protein